jgi:hypothetical protein
MMLVRPTEDDAGPGSLGAAAEALIREARRRRRRRLVQRALFVAVVGGAAIVVAVWGSVGARAPGGAAGATAGVLPNGPFVALHVAGSLAVAPDGALYVANVPGRGSGLGDRVVVRLSDGRFRAVAGSGAVGFSGDRGAAVRAELSDVSDIAVAHDGTLYIADGGRVRVVGVDGVIHTIVGSGRPARMIANGTAALSAALGTAALGSGVSRGDPLRIALSPAGQLYIATSAPQILRLTATGRLDTVRAVVTSGPGKGPIGGPYPIAVDTHGNIDVGGGPGGWTIWQVRPNGTAHLVAGPPRFARGSGGTFPVLRPGPGGAIYAGVAAIYRIQPHKLVPEAALDRPLVLINTRRLNGQVFPLSNFAFSPNGTLYADDLPGAISGFEEHQQLLSIANRHVDLLWQETNPTPR